MESKHHEKGLGSTCAGGGGGENFQKLSFVGECHVNRLDNWTNSMKSLCDRMRVFLLYRVLRVLEEWSDGQISVLDKSPFQLGRGWM